MEDICLFFGGFFVAKAQNNCMSLDNDVWEISYLLTMHVATLTAYLQEMGQPRYVGITAILAVIHMGYALAGSVLQLRG